MLLAPFALEGGYRALRASELSPTTSLVVTRHDERLGWELMPGCVERHATDEFDVEVRVNSRGFRGPEWPSGPARGPRVLILGDSFVFGWGVEWEDSLGARLAALRPDWEVVCAGVSGYGADQECLLYEELRAELAPDVVVVVQRENDLYESASDTVYGRRKPRFELRGDDLALVGVPVVEPWLERVSWAWRALQKERWRQAHLRAARDPNAEWALACAIYRRMRDVGGNAPLLIVSEEERLARLADEEPRIAHADLRPALSAAGVQYASDGHWTALGHERVASALERGIAKVLAGEE